MPLIDRDRPGRAGRAASASALGIVVMLLSACGGGGEGPSHATPALSSREAPANVQGAPVYRFAKISSGAYFYTGSQWEADNIRDNLPDFRYEGIAFYQSDAASGTPVYRFANRDNGGYFYTASAWERDNTIANYPNMRYEGSTFSVAPAGDPAASPVYRVANLQNGAYLYTTNPGERDAAVALGFWRDEGSTFAALTSGSNGGGGNGQVGDYLAYGLTLENGASARFHLIDPTAPVPPRLSLTLPNLSFGTSGRFQVQDSGMTGTYLGAPLGLYVQDGQVYQVSMKRTDPTTPQRISSLTTACQLSYQYGLDPQGDNLWLEIDEAGPDGQCATTADNRLVHVRTGSSAGTAATSLPAGIAATTQLSDETGQLSFILATDRRTAIPKMVLLRPDLSVGPEVLNSNNVQLTREWTIGHQNVRSLYFVSSASILYRLDWSANGAVLSLPLHTFSSSNRALVTGQDGVYLLDDNRVYRTTGGAPTLLATVDSSLGTRLGQPVLTPSAVVLKFENTTNFNSAIVAVPRSGGTPVTLHQENSLALSNFLVGNIGERVIYWTSAAGAIPSQFGELRSILANGQNNTVLSTQAMLPGQVVDRFQDRMYLSLKGAAWCHVPTGQADCRQGEWRYIDLASNTVTTLASFNGSATLMNFMLQSPFNWADLPMPGTTFAMRQGGGGIQSWTDVWIARPGVAGSGTRVTTLIP